MAVTIDATLRGASSNSYITLDDAESIAETLPGGDTWIALTEDDKNMSLVQATRWLETLDYRGERCELGEDDGTDAQRLKWPRKDAVCDGITSNCSSIPYPIREAEVALAIKYTEAPETFPGAGGGNTAPDGTYVKRQKIDVLEIEYDEFSNPESSSCDNCGEPAIIQAFDWLKDALGCWVFVSTGESKMIRLYRN